MITVRRSPLLLLAAPAALLVIVASGYIAYRHSSSSTFGAERAVLGAAAAIAAGVALTARPAWPLSLGLVLSVFSSHWGTIGIPLPLDRLFVAVGMLSTLARERARRPGALAARPVDCMLLVVGLYALGSALWVGSLSDHAARFALADRFGLLGFALFFVARRAYREPRDQRILLGALVVLGGYLGLTAILETTGPSGLILPRYIADPTVGIHFGRARGPFTEANANGMALFTCAVAACIAGVTWHRRRARRLAWAVAGLCMLGVLLTITRSPWIGAIAGSLAALLFARETRRYVFPGAVTVALGVVVAFAVVPHLQERATTRANDQRPIWDRKNSDAAALRMIADRPVLGFGWHRFAVASLEGDYYHQSLDYPLTLVPEVHNVYLDNAVSLGLLGAGLWLAACAVVLLGGTMRRGPPWLRPWKVGLVAVGLSYGVNALFTPLTYAMPSLLVWTWAGIAWGPDGAAESAELGRAPGPGA